VTYERVMAGLIASDAEEEEKKTELRATAKKELEEWYARYHEQIEKSKLANREVSNCKEVKLYEKLLLHGGWTRITSGKTSDTACNSHIWRHIEMLFAHGCLAFFLFLNRLETR
ncbi:hypothetical protein V5799_027835, partial [Amblyomma americanum]